MRLHMSHVIASTEAVEAISSLVDTVARLLLVLGTLPPWRRMRTTPMLSPSTLPLRLHPQRLTHRRQVKHKRNNLPAMQVCQVPRWGL